ncbi:ABC transporter substrate-binding protein [Arthrobacter sp. VKM Ac-2550]|uniref:ABC transporter substrate-binding protein n=1 Tax=Crystallibacter permensis TaxID=1938888 RepID=UPI002225B8EB|nr:ABC transporter substrate-binding protein [Arthrobacter sp. VKM Ac-2550]MCW2132662.1 putative ABC transport system substrate-binding protein [Arthrobacter sp. VKM Ac-2550]
MKRSTYTTMGASLFASALLMTACGNGGGGEAGSGESGAAGEMVEIGITQIVSHPSLDASREGFKKALAENGYTEGENVTYDEQNAQGDQATATSIAGKFATDQKDLVLAIATPTAQAAAQAIQDIPILITAVTDPVEAGLVESLEAPGGNITGTSDLNPVKEQLGLLKELVPDAKSVGIVYSSGEVNSQVQVDLAKKVAAEMGLEIKEATVSNSSEVQQAAQSLDVDAFYVPTDNNVVSALKSLIGVAESKKIPVIASDAASVEGGAVATEGINYEDLGYQTGMMAIEVLEGADPATMPIQTASELEVVVNPAAAERMGVEIPASLLESADRVIE